MGNVPSLGSTPEARRAAKAKLSEPKPRSRSVSNLGAEPDMYGNLPDYYRKKSGGSKLHRNMHRLKLANNKTKRIRRRKNLTLKLRR